MQWLLLAMKSVDSARQALLSMQMSAIPAGVKMFSFSFFFFPFLPFSPRVAAWCCVAAPRVAARVAACREVSFPFLPLGPNLPQDVRVLDITGGAKGRPTSLFASGLQVNGEEVFVVIFRDWIRGGCDAAVSWIEISAQSMVRISSWKHLKFWVCVPCTPIFFWGGRIGLHNGGELSSGEWRIWWARWGRCAAF